MRQHGTISMYQGGCRCDGCRQAARDYKRAHRSSVPDGRRAADHAAISDLLHELCPDGLTDDCPARQARAAAA